MAALRATEVSKRLARRGINVVVLTASEPGDGNLYRTPGRAEATEALLHVVRTPRGLAHGESPRVRRVRVVARLVTAVRYVRTGPFPVWLRSTMKVAATLDRPSAILAIHGNATSLEVARRLSQYWRCPWIADFKDIWDSGMRQPGLRRTMVRWSLARRIRTASAITTSSERTARDFERVFGRSTHAIYSGIECFGEEISTLPAPSDGHFRLVFTGHVQPTGTKLAESIEGIVGAMNAVPEVALQLHYYGWSPDLIRNELLRHDCPEILVDHGYVGPADIKQAQYGADMLLHLPFAGMSVKYLEYVASGRPMLVIPPEGDDSAELFRGDETIIEGQTAMEIAGGLTQELRRWLEFGRRPDVKREVDLFSWDCQTDKMVGVLESVAGNERSSVRR